MITIVRLLAALCSTEWETSQNENLFEFITMMTPNIEISYFYFMTNYVTELKTL